MYRVIYPQIDLNIRIVIVVQVTKQCQCLVFANCIEAKLIKHEWSI